ncbi:MAG: hypothetical protein Q9O62_08055 [Ardenticatenia bacterium]|nr:hypothetical protein [Ardenticatenia bacterium]
MKQRPLHRYELYGLRVCSELPLPAPRARGGAPCDLTFRLGPREAGPPPLGDGDEAEVLAHLELWGRPAYTLTANGAGYQFVFHRSGRFLIDAGLRTVEARPFDGVRPGMAGLLLVNGVIAALLALRGEWVLHAGAVAAGGRALVFVGGIGMGKSTLTAACCALGGRLLTDDLLRLRPAGPGSWRCFPGTGRLRLREGARPLAAAFPAAPKRITPDNRLELTLPGIDPGRPLPELGAVVIPRTSTECTDFRLTRLPLSRAVTRLMQGLKMQGMARSRDLQARLDFAARLAAEVPVFEAEIPWGLEQLQENAAQLARELGFPLNPKEKTP